MITDPVAVFLTLAAVVLISVHLEKRVRLFRSLGAAFTGILLGMILSNSGVLPGQSPTYSFLMGDGVYFGIALILLGVNLRSVLQAGPGMLVAFGIGAVGTAVGALVGGYVLSDLVGPETWKLAGQYAGTYTGGGANFAAVGRAFETSPDLFAAATAADVIITATWMATCLAVPVLLGRSGPGPEAGGPAPEAAPKPATAPTPTPGPEAASKPSGPAGRATGKPATLEEGLNSTVRPLTMANLAALVSIAVGAVWVSGALGSLFPSVPEVLWLTTMVLALAQIPAVKALPGGALLGNYLILLFLASNGARSVVATLVAIGPAVFYFAIVTVAIHGLLIFGVGRLARLDLPTLAVASQANVGGAASAIALAGARGYTDRLVPGVAVGLLGYALGNYIGLAVGLVMKGMLGA
ncbi:MAG: DUF819 family protein [Longimicrobiales bacterium]